MALSLGNHRRAQTSSAAWSASQKQPSSSSHLVRKQLSFVESTGSSASISNTGCGRGYLTRGLSVGRSYDSYRQKIVVPFGGRQKHSTGSIHFQKHASIDHDHIKTTKSKELSLKIAAAKNSQPIGTITRFGSTSNISGVGGARGVRTTLREGQSSRIVAWSSTSSLLRSLDEELSQVIGVLDRKKISTNPLVDSIDDRARKNKQQRHQLLSPKVDHSKVDENLPQMHNGNHAHHQSLSSSKNEVNKVNLNIVLSQTIKATTETEAVFSDFDSSSECADIASSLSTRKRLGSSTNKTIEQTVSSEGAPYRRAQFHSSRQTTATATTTNATSSTALTFVPTAAAIATASQSNNFSASPSLIIQRRPPLVRAMSAPVRSVDENSKSVFAASKRKSRRRKLLSRDISCDKIDTTNFSENKAKDLILDSNKKVLSRARSVVAPDVVTLVSLISSEGSDSEKEDISSATNSDHTPTRRAPLLRKTGKSVSFQENYPPNFQLAGKEYSHMIRDRRGSIAPLAARIRANRPPTAPPVSIFLNLNNSDGGMTSPVNDNPTSAPIRSAEGEKTKSPTSEKENKSTTGNVVSSPEYVFPEYVRSIKERECWKLFQKMSKKGVNVTYDVILRGMLTPTEFRHLQKQRELEEAKIRESEEVAINVDEKVKTHTSAIERLSETLLKK